MDIINIESGQMFDIVLKKTGGEELIKCPECSEERRKKNLKCFSWNHDKEVGFCSHCGNKYGIYRKREAREPYVIPPVNNTQLSDRTVEWFNKRGISKATLIRFGLTESKEYMPQESKEMNCINFNYFRNDQLVNVKYRDGKKNFKMHKGSELIFYGLDLIKDHKEIVVCEGEIDALSIYESGFYYVISVPNGASKGNSKMEYFDNCYEYFTSLEKVILAADNDEPGMILRSELSRRFGREICYTVSYPDGCKDANDVLVRHGREKLIEVLKTAKEYPLEGIATVEDIDDDIEYIFEHGYPKALSIGDDLDNHIKWRTGEWTVITGSPGSGKSDVLDQIALALSMKHEWRFGIFSPENKPYALHFWKLCQKTVGKMRNEMTSTEKDGGKFHIKDHFFWFDIEDPSVDEILAKAKELVVRKGINALIIDPWNQIEHAIPPGENETNYISGELSKLTRFVQNYDVHIFLVAHPSKGRLNPNKLTLYDISGSAHFFNKCYNGLTIHRNLETSETVVNVEKVKFWFVGRAGKSVNWYWDIKQGTRFFNLGSTPLNDPPINYYDPGESIDEMPF